MTDPVNETNPTRLRARLRARLNSRAFHDLMQRFRQADDLSLAAAFDSVQQHIYEAFDDDERLPTTTRAPRTFRFRYGSFRCELESDSGDAAFGHVLERAFGMADRMFETAKAVVERSDDDDDDDSDDDERPPASRETDRRVWFPIHPIALPVREPVHFECPLSFADKQVSGPFRLVSAVADASGKDRADVADRVFANRLEVVRDGAEPRSLVRHRPVQIQFLGTPLGNDWFDHFVRIDDGDTLRLELVNETDEPLTFRGVLSTVPINKVLEGLGVERVKA
jgi:hypothetical protein